MKKIAASGKIESALPPLKMPLLSEKLGLQSQLPRVPLPHPRHRPTASTFLEGMLSAFS